MIPIGTIVKVTKEMNIPGRSSDEAQLIGEFTIEDLVIHLLDGGHAEEVDDALLMLGLSN